ncbi:MAG TPA: ABC transporter substrate-binding protein [Gaiellaceae bacterium]|nr:ABC transporter substrate-binding protein [Gaiellaceae bacterium]
MKDTRPRVDISKASDDVTRRELLRRAGMGALVLAYGASGAKTAVAGVTRFAGRELSGTLKILQWSHFVPAYDKWFDGTYIKDWGQKNDVQVTVDHVNLAELPARGAAEVAAQSGHDLFQFLAPPASYEDSVLDLRDIVQEVTKKLGPMTRVAQRSSYNPRTKKYFGWPDNYVPDPVHWRSDYWQETGRGPNSWEDLRQAAAKLKSIGHPIGIGMSQELDSNMAMIALMQCHGAYIQNEEARVVINSKQTRNALKTMRDIFKRGMTDEVFAWQAASNNQAYVAGRLSLALNAVSIARTLEGPPWVVTPARPDIGDVTHINPIPKGPVQRLGLEHVMGVYVIWKFAQNKAAAKQFLVDMQLNYTPHFQNSGFYNFPGWSNGVKGGFKAMHRLTAQDKHRPLGKYTILTTIAQKYTANVGYPGYSNAAIDEVWNKFLIPQMFAQVAQGKMTPADAASAADREIKQIFASWRTKKKI